MYSREFGMFLRKFIPQVAAPLQVLSYNFHPSIRMYSLYDAEKRQY
jgi:hypothetical protein